MQNKGDRAHGRDPGCGQLKSLSVQKGSKVRLGRVFLGTRSKAEGTLEAQFTSDGAYASTFGLRGGGETAL